MTDFDPANSPSIVSHVSLGTRDLPAALAFYDAVMPVIGARRVFEVEGFAVAYGKQFPEVWVQLPHDEQPADPGNGQHLGFIAPSREAVHRFHEAVLANGGSDDGAPGPRPDYGPQYYGCFARDLDGNKIEASYWDVSAG